MRTVVIESPLAGDFGRNLKYARACLRYCLDEEVAPFASHLLYTQVYDDEDDRMREAGIRAGIELSCSLDERWIFLDLGESEGMQRGRRAAERLAQTVSEVWLGEDWEVRYAPTPTRGAR